MKLSGDGLPLLLSKIDGGVAQLGERLPCTQEVIGSIPFTSTIIRRQRTDDRRQKFSDGCLVKSDRQRKTKSGSRRE